MSQKNESIRETIERAMRQLQEMHDALDRHTSEQIAHLAGKGLKDPLSLLPDEIQAVCASALVQR